MLNATSSSVASETLSWNLGGSTNMRAYLGVRMILWASEYRIDMVFQPKVHNICGVSWVLMLRDKDYIVLRWKHRGPLCCGSAEMRARLSSGCLYIL